MLHKKIMFILIKPGTQINPLPANVENKVSS